eukprot:CAMPEP_0174315946 /NCGR_PEP_ID=MMETSP0810-20121108/6611_1 /TAXON_ID=73025 ORGANISM="Eutreptiella gymnastica-like, Strain CCMP1594" /NCGR_SAMPLE_ID=MMETSP0810 /ASSEMBLY_ACC=CAM_ASM_000659 /LENGTH=97 /DNA_ID=CAMNT_0015425473 /DNA_START=466 /DNA_END=759 /DNA_ORIENTATION=-
MCPWAKDGVPIGGVLRAEGRWSEGGTMNIFPQPCAHGTACPLPHPVGPGRHRKRPPGRGRKQRQPPFGENPTRDALGQACGMGREGGATPQTAGNLP